MLAVFDLEGTLTRDEFWDFFPQTREATAGAMEGRLGFREAMELRLATVRPMPYADFAWTGSNVLLREGAAETVRRLREAGFEVAIASGAFDFLVGRIAAELGAQMVKTYYCEDFEKVVKSCPVPLVIAGGPKLKTELDVLKLAHSAIASGAKGVDMGRNIWQSSNPIGMIKAIRAIVHEGATTKTAQKIFDDSK